MNELSWLLSAEAIRERCERIYRAAEADSLTHFTLNIGRLDEAADLVIDASRANYPDLKIPYHSRWRHFSAGGIDRWQTFLTRHSELSPQEIVRLSIDLVVTSVLLDAGAGEAWRYREPGGNRIYQRSEGLAVASFHMFNAGVFSSDPTMPYRVDAESLGEFSEDKLVEGFQISNTNPLIGTPGRVALLNRLGAALQSQPALFGSSPPRIGNLFDVLSQRAIDKRVRASDILRELLQAFAAIWPGGTVLCGQSLGDVGRHSIIVTDDLTNGLVPFHKLSQWLTYSLVEPLEQAGLMVTDLDLLTGLPEYRNGGLFIDTGVLQPKRQQILDQPQPVDSEPIVEWRALTVALLDRIAARVRARLDLSRAELPLAMVLEGGTWSAGRRIASALRPNGNPPIRLSSDGTVF